jgi:hypothetical protein
MVNKLPLLALCTGSLLLSSGVFSAELAKIGRLDGATGLITTCIAVHDAQGEPATLANGNPEQYQVNLSLSGGNSSDGYLFQLSSAEPVVQADCSGKFLNDSYTDTLVLHNLDAFYNGKIYRLKMDLLTGDQIALRTDLSPAEFYEVRNLNSNSSNLGNSLGSFAAPATIQFNTVNVPYSYTLTAPACSDPDGDDAIVIIEKDSVLVNEVTPGAAFSVSTRDFSGGSFQLKAYCSDVRQTETSAIAEYRAKSAYASGTLTFTVQPDPACSTPLNHYVENLDVSFPDFVPSWSELGCFTSSQTRMPAPKFFIQAADEPPSSDGGGERGSFFEFISDAIAYFDAWPQSNANFVQLQEAPPYLTGGKFQYSSTEWDQKLRAMAAYGIYLKALGNRVSVSYYYPPHLSEPGEGLVPIFNSPEELLEWWEQVYIPERIDLAEMAETIQAEYYQPWDVEPGQQFRALSDQFIDTMTPDEQVALTQQLIDTLYAAIRPIYSGTLILITYDRFEFYPHMKALDFSAWDQVHFVLFTEGDAEGTQYYLERQLAGYAEIVQRDNLQNWVFQEVTVNGDTHQRLLDQYPPYYQFKDIEADIYQVLFDAFDAMPVQPHGIGITTGHIETEAAMNLVQERLTELNRANQ